MIGRLKALVIAGSVSFLLAATLAVSSAGAQVIQPSQQTTPETQNPQTQAVQELGSGETNLQGNSPDQVLSLPAPQTAKPLTVVTPQAAPSLPATTSPAPSQAASSTSWGSVLLVVGAAVFAGLAALIVRATKKSVQPSVAAQEESVVSPSAEHMPIEVTTPKSAVTQKPKTAFTPKPKKKKKKSKKRK